ncbi:protein FAR1-RELATED SEQUENCE 5-like [Spinacia oleracea]|uniref:Protein FAR1-RELATED SEQUENCE 5-like n=1 Tax=Spinacia oleracea TaxID=3562 RepID=A0A9R0JEQ1_SPIOL|nr:protein FAR1-RELATED SEQUENCE 5-like [Spinacia oleracea]
MSVIWVAELLKPLIANVMDNIKEHPRLPIDLNESGELEEGDTPREGLCFGRVRAFFFIKSSDLLKEFKDVGVCRSGVGEKEAMADMMKRINLKCKRGVGAKTEGCNVPGCKMYVYGILRGGKFEIIKCDLKHNNELNPSCSYLMVNYRSIDQGTFEREIINDNAGISINRNFSALVLERGGFDNMTFNNRDLRNAINLDQGMSRCLGDAKELQDYLKKQHELNNDYYRCLQVDDGGTLLNAFWSDARSRDSYKYFGDVITFDTTFSVNRFRMPFAPFIGIFTDQCRAIGKAVELVFIGVPHRFFLWHLLQNASKNLGSNANWKDIDCLIRTAVHDMMDQEKFDEAWCIIMDKYGLREAESEGMNRFFKTQVNLRCGLVTFVKRYEHALKNKAAHEADNNLKTREKPLKFNKTILAEYVFQKLYTNAMFAEVKKECESFLHTNVTKNYALGSTVFYIAVERFPTVIWRKRFKTYDVICDKRKGEFCCSCKLFEFRGILCRHIIRAMSTEDMEFIPEKYILERWKKDVRSYENIKVSYYDPEESAMAMKAKDLAQRHNYLSTLAMHNDVTFALYNEATDKIRLTLEDVAGTRKTGERGDELQPW